MGFCLPAECNQDVMDGVQTYMDKTFKHGFEIIDNLLPGGLSSLYPTLPVKTNYTRPSVLVLNSDTELNRENASRHDGFIIVMTLLAFFFVLFHVYPNIRMCFS